MLAHRLPQVVDGQVGNDPLDAHGFIVLHRLPMPKGWDGCMTAHPGKRSEPSSTRQVTRAPR